MKRDVIAYRRSECETRRRPLRIVVAFVLILLGWAIPALLHGQQAPPKKSRAETEAERIANAFEEPSLVFACDQVDVRTFVKMIGGSLGHKFVIDDNVKGKVTVVSPKVRKKDAFPLFVSILESAGCSVVREGDIYRVVALPEKSVPVAPVVGVGEPHPDEGLVTKVFLLEHVSADDIRRGMLDSAPGSKPGAVIAVRETNHLIVTDTIANIRRIEKLLAQIDRPGLAKVTEVVALSHAGAEDLARQLNLAIAESETRAEQLRSRLPQAGDSVSGRRNATVVPAPHSNSLILVGTPAQLASLKSLIAKMDLEPPLGRGRLNAIFLRYISAEDAAKSLNNLLGRTPANDKPGGGRSDRIAIEPSAGSNALLVDATPSDFDVVRRLVDQIDVAPEQVHIEVVIVEHTVNDDLKLGVEFVALDMPAKAGSTVVQGGSALGQNADSLMNAIQKGVFPNGITLGVARGERVDASGKMVASYPVAINIDALRKTGQIKIRSETSLQTQNNREASINVVEQIPILKSTIQGGSGTARDVIQNIERMDVGVKLKMTPHIVPDGEVQMTLNTSIEAVIDPGPAATPFAPTIARREVLTTVAVPDGKVIVIAGLTRDDRSESVKRFPILGSIPLIGLLFRHTVEISQKTNILILVTPRVVSDTAAAERVGEDWRTKTKL
ncbi:MAG: type II secretion system secretin GspD [Verrucomicrobiota bacterium]|nr:type II secretion system secretin GspD [Verrucomicrobiota bacterium]